MISQEQQFRLNGEYIELYKLIKFESIATSGGGAKAMIAEGVVQVNGEQELRKRKKLVVGDIVCIADQKIRIIADD